MRVTTTMFTSAQTQHLNRAQSDLLRVQEELATGKRIGSPGDDPAGALAALSVTDRLARLAQHEENTDFARGALASLDTTLGTVLERFDRVRELAVQGSNGTLNQSDREAIAAEIDQISSEMLGILNSDNIAGRMFGGTANDAEPWTRSESANGARYAYGGNGQEVEIHLSESLRMGLTLDGFEIFGSGGRGATEFDGSTGAAAGQGTDSLTGRDVLTFRHERTTLGDGLGPGGGDSVTGVGVGVSSEDGNTVLGSLHGIQVEDLSGTGDSGTVSLNGGPPVSWTRADDDLRVEGPNGAVVYLDLSSVVPGAFGGVAVDAEGSVSLDGGKTLRPIDFTANGQSIRDSETGEQVFVDMTAVRFVGEETLRVPGTFDMLAALDDISAQLRGVEDGEDAGATVDLISEIERFSANVAIARGEVGARMNLVDSTASQLGRVSLDLEQRRSQLEDTDFSEASVRLINLENQIQATLSLTARMSSLPSLMDLV